MINLSRIKGILNTLTPRQRAWLSEGLGWVIFLAVLVWFYRIPPWLWRTHIPGWMSGFGDVIEALWQIEFWRTVALTGRFDPVSLAGMYPLGLHQFSIAHVGTGLLLLPASLLVGSAAALNIGFVASHVLCFAGARLFLKQYISSALLASFGAIAFTFALGRTSNIYPHLHIALATAFITWTAAMASRLRSAAPKQAWKQAILGGITWGLGIIAQPYALFFGALPFILLGRQWRAWRYALAAGVCALVVSGPFLLGLYQGMAAMSSLSPNLFDITRSRSSLSSYAGWSRLSYWPALREINPQRPKGGEINEQNWGILILLLSAAGVIMLWRLKAHRSLIMLGATAFVLSMGPLWIDGRIDPALATRVNEPVWQAARALKPDLFDRRSEVLKSQSLPLPAIVPMLVLPRFEQARMPGRYSVWVGLAAVALSAFALSRLPRKWGIAIGCLWVVELLPVPNGIVNIPSTPHPAHVWAAQVIQPDRSVLSSGIQAVYSHHLAGDLPGTSAVGSFIPSYLIYTYPWIVFSPYPSDPPPEALTDPSRAVILRRAQVGIVLLTPEAADLARQNSALRFVQCFEPEANVRIYYPYTLCAFEVLPAEEDFFAIQPVSGFSGFGPDFVWIEGTHAKAGWRISQPTTHTIDITLRAFCPPGGQQSVVITLNGRQIASHTWPGNCWERWTATLTVSPEQLNAGWNTIEFEAASAAQPYLYDPNSKDQRKLSVGVERLHVSSTNPAR